MRSRRARGVELAWRPFLLGPIFAAQGWRDSPFNIYPAKGRYMWRDLERICDGLGLPLRRPDPFPQNTLLAARVALALDGAERAEFSRRVYEAEFGEGLPIADRATLTAVLAKARRRPERRAGARESEANKALLKAERRARPRSAFSARPASSRETARSSGATTGSSRGSTGRRARP